MSGVDSIQTLTYQRQEAERTDAQLQQEQFLEIMIAQLQSQDPTSPQDADQFLGQLAQFGTVEGINNLNRSFESMSASLSANQALQAANLVDREVMIPGDTVFVGPDQPTATGAVELGQTAQQLMLRITNEVGETVRTINLEFQPAGTVEFEWDGLDGDDNPVPEGSYRISAEAQFADGFGAVPTLISARVESIAFGNGSGPTLVELRGLGQIPLNEIRSISSVPVETAPAVQEEPDPVDDVTESDGEAPTSEESAFGVGAAKFFSLNSNRNVRG